MTEQKYLDYDGLLYYDSLVEDRLDDKLDASDAPTALTDLNNDGNFVQDASYVHTDSNYTSSEKSKLAGIEEGAEENDIDSITVGGTVVPPSSKTVALGSAAGANVETTGVSSNTTTLPTTAQVKSFVEGKGYQTATDVATAIAGAGHLAKEVVNSVPSAANADPDTLYYVMNATTNHYDIYQLIGNDVVLLDDVAIDLSGYVQSSDLVAITNAEIDAIVSGQNASS